MTFVTCMQFKNSQAAQDEKLNKLEECCQKGTEKNAEQDKAISTLQNGALSADDALVDKTGVSDGQGKGAGKITVAKIKEAIEGDLAIAVDTKKGLSGNGKKGEPLAVNAKEGDFKFNEKTGALELGNNALQADNIGNGLKYDPDTGKYVVDAREANGIKANPDGSVGLAVSAQPGNLIQLRNDGVYYGTEAKPDLSNLYVSSTLGNDNNPGTREAPFRTITGALNRLQSEDIPAWYTIYLRAGEEFDWVAHVFNNAKFTFRVYDEPLEESYLRNPERYKVPYYRVHTARDFNRPTILVKKRVKTPLLMRDNLTAQSFNFYGIVFELDDQDRGSSELEGHIAGFVNAETGKAHFEGCVFKFSGRMEHIGRYRVDSWIRVKTVSMINCKLANDPSQLRDERVQRYSSQLLYGPLNPSLAVAYWAGADGNLQGAGVFPNLPCLVSGINEARKNITLNNLAVEITWDASTKTLFGANTNWDIFASS